MHLLHTETLQIGVFHSNLPRYAILSHTWDEEEISFWDIQDLDEVKDRLGYRKIWYACAHAQKYGFEWIWIDSCCIDKDSSAELSEALISMYQFYGDSDVCYVYLSDAQIGEDPGNFGSTFRRCKWFTRGWTLQELLAPSHVVFLDKNWEEIGTRWSLRGVISAITSIPVQVFWGFSIHNFSIAQKMSWAAYRETTRPEDRAYSLMGIFGISMPPLYGEGGVKAFMRLQQEIIRYSGDRSIFAWISDVEAERTGLLARTPYAFRASGKVGTSDPDLMGNHALYSFRNNSLQIHLPMEPVPEDNDIFLASLHCRSESDGSYVSLYLHKAKGGYVREMPHKLVLTPKVPPSETTREIIVHGELLLSDERKWVPSEMFSVLPDPKLLPSAQNYFSLHRANRTNTMSPFVGNATDTVLSLRGGRDGTVELFLSRRNDHDDGVSIAKFQLLISPNQPQLQLAPGPTDRDEMSWPLSADRFLLPYESGAQISLALQVTGDLDIRYHRMLEIDYIAPENTHILHSFQEQSTYYKFDLLVDSSPFSLSRVVPYDFCQKTLDSEKSKFFVSLPGDIMNLPISFRVLTFKGTLDGEEVIIHVAAGFYESKPWIDMLYTRLDDQREGAEDIWQSYLDSGSRANERSNPRSHTSIVHDGKETRSQVTAFIEKRLTIMLHGGTHILRFEKLENRKPRAPHGNWAPPSASAPAAPAPAPTLPSKGYEAGSPYLVQQRSNRPAASSEPLPAPKPRIPSPDLPWMRDSPVGDTRPLADSPIASTSNLFPVSQMPDIETDLEDDDNRSESPEFYSLPASPV